MSVQEALRCNQIRCDAIRPPEQATANGAGLDSEAAVITEQANLLRWKALVTTEALLAEVEAVEAEKRVEGTCSAWPVEAKIAELLKKKSLMAATATAATSIVRNWAKDGAAVTFADFEHNLRLLGLESAVGEAELLEVFKGLDGKGGGRLEAEEMRLAFKKFQKAVEAAEKAKVDGLRLCADLRRRAKAKGDEAKAAALDAVVVNRRREKAQGAAKQTSPGSALKRQPAEGERREKALSGPRAPPAPGAPAPAPGAPAPAPGAAPLAWAEVKLPREAEQESPPTAVAPMVATEGAQTEAATAVAPRVAELASAEAPSDNHEAAAETRELPRATALYAPPSRRSSESKATEPPQGAPTSGKKEKQKPAAVMPPSDVPPGRSRSKSAVRASKSAAALLDVQGAVQGQGSRRPRQRSKSFNLPASPTSPATEGAVSPVSPRTEPSVFTQRR